MAKKHFGSFIYLLSNNTKSDLIVLPNIVLLKCIIVCLYLFTVMYDCCINCLVCNSLVCSSTLPFVKAVQSETLIGT